VGEVAKTKAPEPCSSEMEAERTEDKAVVAKFEEASVKMAREAVRPDKVIVPEEVIPVSPEIAPVAVKAPVSSHLNLPG